MSCDPIRLIPGSSGQNGIPGTNGTDGISAFTHLTEEFTMPAEGGTDTAVVQNTAMLANGETIYLRGAGTLLVDVIVDGTDVILKNISDAANGIYPDNVAPGSIITIGFEVVPTGLQGPAGPAGTNGTNGTNGGEAFTTLSAPFTMPAEGANAAANVVDSSGLVVGETTFLSTMGFLRVASITSSVLIALTNLKNTGASQYVSNVAPGIVSANGLGLVSAGIQGPQGSQGIQGIQGVPGAAGGSLPYALYQNQQANTTSAGEFTSGSFVTVPLNTEVTDVGNIGAIAANQVTLIAGTYRARWSVPGYQVNSFISRLRNITDAADIQIGQNARASSGDDSMEYSVGEARFTIALAKVIELQAQCATTKTVSGRGLACSLGVTEVYATLEFWKES